MKNRVWACRSPLYNFSSRWLIGSPEEEMATHLSILVGKIPWTEEPGRLQSMGLQRVRHDWACTHAHTHNLLHSPASSRNVLYQDRNQAQEGVLHEWCSVRGSQFCLWKRKPAKQILECRASALRLGFGISKHWLLPLLQWVEFSFPPSW